MKCTNCNKEMSKEDIELRHPNGLCEECYINEMHQEDEQEQMVQVTREMAMDACDPSLEGQWIRW